MLQNFRRQYYRLATDPAMVLMLPFWPLYIWGLTLHCGALWGPSCAALLAIALWQRCGRILVGENFQAFPTLPGGYRTIGQRVRKGEGDISCAEMLRSLVRDSIEAANDLPAGRYQAVTHEIVLNRMKQTAQICVESCVPIYRGTLRPVLRAQTHNRCRRCEKPCSAWNAPCRQFYLVRFCVNEIAEKENEKCEST